MLSYCVFFFLFLVVVDGFWPFEQKQTERKKEQEALQEDSDWVEVVDQLSAELRN